MKHINFEVKGYATHKNALAKATQVLGTFGKDADNLRVVVLALESGRFAPAAVITSDTEWMAGMLAQRGICVL